MVAHGTIAFDTLTTSDQVKTGTEKSLDTSYVFNGSAKAWCNYTTAATFVNNGSFNVTTTEDAGDGSCKLHFTNVFNDDDYSTTGLQTVGAGQLGLNAQETTYTWCISYNTSNAAADSGESTMTAHGDLA